MFTTIIVQPISNLLILIMSILPRHNFGLSIIIFTVIVRLLMWPLVKKQINHAKAMRELQPELKKIKKAAAGDRQKESKMVMELYKEREINPFASILILVVQIPILIGLYSGLRKIINDPHAIVTLSYAPIQHLAYVQGIAHNVHSFDATFLGFIDLTRKATGVGGLYFPAFALALGSAFAQYLVSKQLMPKDENARGLKDILRGAGSGKSADQSEVNAAVGRATIYIIPVFVFLASLNFPAALPLYWLTSSVVAYFQQARILNEDVAEAEKSIDKPALVAKPAPQPAKPIKTTSKGVKVTRSTLPSQKPKSSSKRKRRRR